MKRLAILMSLIVTFAGCFTSLSAQKTFRVFKHDGSLNVFLYSNIDSITYSNIDENGMLQDYVVTQNIHTPDSVYRFNVSEIDSVAFTPLPTIYKPDAIRIEGRLRDYVLGADSLTLFLKRSIPESLLPKAGDNIATLECDDVLPYGFLGRVERITQRKDTIDVDCTKPALTDIYESLELVISTEDTGKAESRSYKDPNQHKLTIPPLRGSVDFKNEIEASDELSGSYDMNAFVELRTDECTVYSVLNVIPRFLMLPQIYWDFTYTAQNTLSIGSSISAEVEWNKEFKIESIRNIRIPGAAAVLEFFEEGGIFVNIAGSIGLNGSYTKPFTTVIHYTHNPTGPVAIPPTFKMIGRPSTVETTLEGEASISVGLYGKIGVGTGAEELAALEAGFRIGPKFSSSLSLTPTVSPIEVINTEMYDEMDRDDFFRGDLTLTGTIEAKVLNDTKIGAELEFGDMLFKNPFFQRGIVPHFDKVSLTENEKAGTLTAGATISRKLMFDTPVGFALYDSDKKLVDHWWSPTKYKDKEGEKISHDFGNLKANKEYTLHPITRAFKDNMVANPSNDAKIIPNIITDKATNISDKSAVLHALFEKISEKDECKFGFYYGLNTNVGPTDGVYLPANSHDNEISVNVDNILPGTKYYYRACATVNGETFFAGNIESFITQTQSDKLTHEIWLTPHRAMIIFPNTSSFSHIPFYSAGFSSDSTFTEWDFSPLIALNRPPKDIPGMRNVTLSPNTRYWYKMYSYLHDQMTVGGSFITPSEVTVMSPTSNIHDEHGDLIQVWDPSLNNFVTIGKTISEAWIRFGMPYIGGLNPNLYEEIMNSYRDSYDFDYMSIGVIYSDSPEKLSFLNPNVGDTQVNSVQLKPGTYYYCAYFSDAYIPVIDKNGTMIAVGPNGELLGDSKNEDVRRKSKHLRTFYGNIKTFTIPDKIIFE